MKFILLYPDTPLFSVMVWLHLFLSIIAKALAPNISTQTLLLLKQLMASSYPCSYSVCNSPKRGEYKGIWENYSIAEKKKEGF